MKILRSLPLVILLSVTFLSANAQNKKVRVFIIGATDKYHSPMVDKAEPMFRKMAAQNDFDVHFTRDTSEVNLLNLAGYQVFVQLHLAPFDMSPSQQYAIQEFISKGKGYLAIHAAGLTGEEFGRGKDNYWQWFDDLLGGVSYTPHPPLQEGTVVIEDHNHPITQDLPTRFNLRDEWYEFDTIPRKKDAQVLAVADESTYHPRKPMGYHPVIWVNPNFNRVAYISIGHDSTSCRNPSYIQLLTNAIRWAASGGGQEQAKMEAFLKSPATILTNQVGYNTNLPKTAMLRTKEAAGTSLGFTLIDARTLKAVYSGVVGTSRQVSEWSDDWYSPIEFSDFNTPGYYKIEIEQNQDTIQSFDFEIAPQLLTKTLIPAIAGFFNHQKANSPEELSGDAHVRLYGSDKTVDLRGGWCDASGDVSKYFSHLAYTNYMNPQQTPMVDWSLIQTAESIPDLLDHVHIRDSIQQEALYGADYLMKSLSPEGYFYMTLFSYFKKDPNERRVVGLLANSVTTSDYRCGYREGGGMGVAALARISQWSKGGHYQPAEYLAAAEKAFDHLQKHSIQYIDDHKENILDDYTALMASTELWIATGKEIYQKEARRRAQRLEGRLSKEGFFWSDDEKTRPFWHAADAGLPILSLIRYLDAETDKTMRSQALAVIKRAIDYQLSMTNEVTNPFEYPRQTFRVNGKIMNGFFIPHENESGWWWQGEDARLGSLATAILRGGRLVYPADGPLRVKPEIAAFVCHILNWELGDNPFEVCMMYGFGQINVPYMGSMYGHGTGIGGISNGITGKKGNNDGTGIDFRYEDNGNEWRWSEQWIPHTAWFLQALAALESKN